jgi:predicted nucleic acid-binding protein
MRVLLDTTYLMSAIGIQVKSVPQNTLSLIRGGGHEAAISELTLFELSAKGAKYIASRVLDPDRVRRGVLTVARDEGLVKIPLLDEEVLKTSLSLRGILGDYLDCVILSSAINKCDTILTEDGLIRGLPENQNYRELINRINPGFTISSSKALPSLS